jgi:hypothetical protein
MLYSIVPASGPASTEKPIALPVKGNFNSEPGTEALSPAHV